MDIANVLSILQLREKPVRRVIVELLARGAVIPLLQLVVSCISSHKGRMESCAKGAPAGPSIMITCTSLASATKPRSFLCDDDHFNKEDLISLVHK
jgi:hypothetical protein